MSAVIVAFPARPAPVRRARRDHRYDFLVAEAMRWRAGQERQGLLDELSQVMRSAAEPPTKPTAEDEILKLLRRIDRRLAKAG